MANGGSHLADPARQSPGACDGRRGQSWAAERGSGQRPEAGEGGFDDSTSMAGGGSCRCLADAVSTAATIQTQSSWQEVNAIVLAVVAKATATGVALTMSGDARRLGVAIATQQGTLPATVQFESKTMEQFHAPARSAHRPRRAKSERPRSIAVGRERPPTALSCHRPPAAPSILSAHHNGPRGRHHPRRSIGAVGDAVTLAVDFTAGADADPDNGVSAHSGTYPVAAFVAELRP